MHYGVSVIPQNNSWDEMKEAALLVERLGYESLWTWDHFLPIVGDPTGSNLEGWQILPAWAALTERIRIGMLVTGNTYRHPAVLAKMVATLDHISHGRAILGIGAAWYELEHNQYGIDFGTSPGDRLARLAEALPIIRSLLDNTETTFSGKYYQVTGARAEPKPVQGHLPIMIGGGGEQKTLRLVARYGDMWNGAAPPDVIARKLEILKGHCKEAGTDFDRILTTVVLNVVIRDTEAEAAGQLQAMAARHKITSAESPIPTVLGPPSVVAQAILAYARIGIKGVLLMSIAPFDPRTIERFQREVRPLVAQQLVDPPGVQPHQ